MYAKILVPLDGSDTSVKGLREATRLARLTGGQLRLLHVNDLQALASYSTAGLGLTPEVLELVRQGGDDLLAKARAEVEAAGVPVQTQMIEAVGTRVSDLVVQVAGEWGAELIVLGTHGRRGLGRALMGSDAEQIVRHAPVPVLLVRGGKA
ncbi:MAG: universal stress protein [Burkholderiaceae bacterium]